MSEILSLENFFMTRLSIDWHAPDKPLAEPDAIKTIYNIDYDVRRRKDDEHLFALTMRFTLIAKKGRKPIGYEINTEITGLFRFPEGTDETTMQKFIRLNGTFILYGILRGEVAIFTGSFPKGKFILPAVNMQEIVAQAEAQKKTSKKGSTAKKKTLGHK